MIKKYLLALSICFLAVVALPAQAAVSGATGPNTSIENPFKGSGNSLAGLFESVISNVLLPIGGVVAVLAFIWAGFMFVTAQGDPAKITTAKTALWYTAIGTAVLLGAEAISLVLKSTITSLS